MIKVDLALIGGTGIGTRLATLGGRAIAHPTPFGMLRGKITEHNDAQILLVQRHAAGHKTPPHHVNYRAIAWGVKSLGAKLCIASAAVGCLRAEWPVGSLALCTDFLDLSARNVTLFDQKVEHTDMTHPFPAYPQIQSIADQIKIPLYSPAIYVTNPGPRYESPAEIEQVRRLGGDLVGMTASTEAIAMREAGVPYSCIALVTNHAAGMGDEKLDHEDVVRVMNESGQLIVDLMLAATQLVK
ncbi:MAG: MTAP family purine nucleoside phosphorylase [Fimbriimonadaceae bacterium]